jgi:hypothetical protein
MLGGGTDESVRPAFRFKAHSAVVSRVTSVATPRAAAVSAAKLVLLQTGGEAITTTTTPHPPTLPMPLGVRRTGAAQALRDP